MWTLRRVVVKIYALEFVRALVNGSSRTSYIHIHWPNIIIISNKHLKEKVNRDEKNGDRVCASLLNCSYVIAGRLVKMKFNGLMCSYVFDYARFFFLSLLMRYQKRAAQRKKAKEQRDVNDEESRLIANNLLTRFPKERIVIRFENAFSHHIC